MSIGHGQPTDTFTVDTQQHLDRGYTALECDQCEATWVGPDDEPCPWCQEAAEHQLQWQAELTLTPPDTDDDDQQRPHALEAWAQRLTIAINAGIITKQQALNAWERAL